MRSSREEVSRRGLGPSRKRPWLLQRLRRLVALSPPRLGGERGRDVVVEDVLVPRLVVAAVPPPVAEELAGRGDHRRHEDEQLGWEARPHERRREAASECPTTARSPRSPTARTTVSVYSDQPADSSSLGRSTATGSCPRSRRAGATRCQSQALPPPPMDERNRGHAQRSPIRNRMTGIDTPTL
jgi:hypothetical protein